MASALILENGTVPGHSALLFESFANWFCANIDREKDLRIGGPPRASRVSAVGSGISGVVS